MHPRPPRQSDHRCKGVIFGLHVLRYVDYEDSERRYQDSKHPQSRQTPTRERWPRCRVRS